MNTSSKSRNGNRELPMSQKGQLSHSLNRRLNRLCTRSATRMLDGARRPRSPDELRSICRLLEHALRLHQGLARRDPHLFGPHAHRYFLDTVKLAQDQQEIDAALCKVYGPPPPGSSATGSTIWTDRYVFRTPQQQRFHRRWFKEQYG